MGERLIAVTGIGAIGRGIVACCLARGFRTTALVTEADSADEITSWLRSALTRTVREGALPISALENWESRFETTCELGELRDASFVIESIPENLDLKRTHFQALERAVADDTVLTTNTSAFPIGDIQSACRRPERVVGMHWSAYGHVTRFLEITPGPQTDQRSLDRTTELAEQLGKEPAVLKKDIPGFICNRLGYAMYREAIHLLEQGVADAATIDRSVRNSFGLWASFCGPLRWIDISGGAAFYARSMAGVLPSLSDSSKLAPTLKDMIERDAKGVKDSVGFYQYMAGDAAKWAEGFEASIVNTWRFQEGHVPRDADPNTADS